MVERKYNPLEDYRVAFLDKNGSPVIRAKVAATFVGKSAEHQAKLAYGCFNKNLDSDFVFSCLTEEGAVHRVKIWCLGKDIRVPSDRERDGDRARNILSKDQELIDKLGPHLRQVDLARLITLKSYRERDEKDNFALICGVYRLLGEYLGPRRYYRPEGQNPSLLTLPELPPEIFSDNLVREILFESEREAMLPIQNKSRQEGKHYLAELKATVTEPLQLEFINELDTYFEKVDNLKVPGFKSEILGSLKDVPESEENLQTSPFPSYHQQEFAYRFLDKPIGQIDLLIGATGTMKSGAAQVATRAAGSKSPVIVCPSGINKQNWARELQEKLEDKVEIRIFDSLRELRTLAIESPLTKPAYTIIGFQLLSRLNLDESPEMLQKLIKNLGWDGLIVDEAHLANEPKANCSKQLQILTRLLPKSAPRIAMTATGVVNGVEDLDELVRILLPDRYPNSGDFTRAARNDPHLVAALLHGDKIMTRWTGEAILGDELPEVNVIDEPVPLSPLHQYIYDFVYNDDTVDYRVKRMYLRQAALDPMLIRRLYYPDRINEYISQLTLELENQGTDREKETLKERINALEERLDKVRNLSSSELSQLALEDACQKFLEWKQKQDPDEEFSEDFLVKLGYRDEVIWAFFNLPGGFDEIVRRSQNQSLKSLWQSKDGIYSSKYRVLKGLIDKYLEQGDQKIVIGSGFYQTGVSSGIEDLKPEDDLAFFSLYDNLRAWYGDRNLLKIDGTVTIQPKKGELALREQVRRAWRLYPDTMLLATIRSSRLGLDFTVPPIEINKYIKGIVIFVIDLPDTYTDLDQFIGRWRRKGGKLPITLIHLKLTNPEQPKIFRYGFIDHGNWERVEFKRILSQMVLDAVPPTDEDKEKVKQHLSTLRVEVYPKTPKSYLYNDFFKSVRGKGSQANIDFFSQNGFEGMQNSDFFRAFYPENDQLTLSGQSARALSEIIRKISPKSLEQTRIASVGAGAGILQFNLKSPVVNFDLLPDILKVAKRRNQNEGAFITGDASSLPSRSGIFDITDASFMLHWSNNKQINRRNGKTSERAEILEELNRVTAQNGTVIITVPPTYLNREQFIAWKETLENDFGFRIKTEIPSGLLRATDFKIEELAWIFVLEKVAEPSGNYDLKKLSFEFERIFEIINRTGQKPQNGKVVSVQEIPHSEFEIIDPSGTVERIEYKHPDETKRIEEILLEDLVATTQTKANLTDELSILAEGGSEEYGLFMKLSREARSRFNITRDKADSLAVETIQMWSKIGTQKYDLHKIWQETKSMMEEIYERRRNNDN